MTPRCSLHDCDLERGLKKRLSATVLTGRKTVYLSAERTQFPFARRFDFCRTGSLDAEFCPRCRAVQAAWLKSRGFDDLSAEITPSD